jgi:hypothetical protein
MQDDEESTDDLDKRDVRCHLSLTPGVGLTLFVLFRSSCIVYKDALVASFAIHIK